MRNVAEKREVPMKSRLSVSQRTAPLACAAIEAWGFAKPTIDPTTYRDSPALKRLISFGIMALGLWFLLDYGLPALHWAFPSQAEVLKTREFALSEAMSRACAWKLGDYYEVNVPGVGRVQARWKGSIAKGAPFPKDPARGDMYRKDDVYWVWAVPIGAKAPAWVDP
jgi:hypothetical protein